ncbi:MurR/RpiR family transcriptional regulator [Oricola sp.]|uniref:MurR/RpiR family transcriptional regulator n=1 Tax=Oricola sp. TaxID=1979950 RepID=UPI0025CD6242|nr:MurR/RpiR family transcriptional regulator [Oricola sp.]MCI5076934.1 MurR/RpiR family transcriptional regulator [Oricola sp.]
MRIRERMDTLTPSERQLVSVLLQDYPVAGLGSITELAKQAGVSTPTVIRTARKLGFEGFPDMQGAIREEIAAQIKEPISRRDAGRANARDDHTLNQFADAVSANIRNTLQRLNPDAFDTVVKLLADPKRDVYLAGGRITRSNADYFFNHLQIIRPNVTLLSQTPNVWPQYLLDMGRKSVLVLFDIRRYESDLAKLAKLAHDRDCTIVLFTDQWGSPISRLADHCFHALVEAPSSWDSTIAIMLIVEALIADVQAARWEDSKGRIEELESMFGKTKLFRNQG